MTFILFVTMLVCLALYFYSATQSALALRTGANVALFIVDRLIAKFTKTAGSFFFVRFALVCVVTYPAQMIYNAGLETSENAAALYTTIFVAACAVLFLLLVLRNRQHFGPQSI